MTHGHPSVMGHTKHHGQDALQRGQDWEDTTTERVRGKKTQPHRENITLNHLKMLRVLFVLQLTRVRVTAGAMGSGKPKQPGKSLFPRQK